MQYFLSKPKRFLRSALNLEHVEKVMDILDNNNTAVAIYLDLTKALAPLINPY